MALLRLARSIIIHFKSYTRVASCLLFLEWKDVGLCTLFNTRKLFVFSLHTCCSNRVFTAVVVTESSQLFTEDVGHSLRQNHNVTTANKSSEKVAKFKYSETALRNQNSHHEEIKSRLNSRKVSRFRNFYLNVCVLKTQTLKYTPITFSVTLCGRKTCLSH
jgi:hypothetical protein